MYYVGAIVVVLFLLLSIVSWRTDCSFSRTGLFGILDRNSTWIYRKGLLLKNRKRGRWRLRDPGNDFHIKKTLEHLHPGEKVEKKLEEYVVQKISLCMLFLLAGTVLSVIVFFNEQQERAQPSVGAIARPNLGDKPIAYELHKVSEKDQSGEDIGDWNFQVDVWPRQPDEEELSNLADACWEAVLEIFLKENASMDAIQKDVVLPSRMEGYPFLMEWESSDAEIIAPGSGYVSVVNEDTLVSLIADISYGDWHQNRELSVIVRPPVRTQEESDYYELQEYLMRSEELSREEEDWILPQEYLGKRLVWEKNVDGISQYIWAGVLILAVLIYFFSDRDLDQKLEEKKRQMKKVYPDITQKMVLYMGAGMTVRAAFIKIAEEATKENSVIPGNPIYQEMIFTVRELRSGVSEGDGYERFGRRTGLQEYVRFGTLLEQNIKKGSSELLPRLREESATASEERLQNCRRIGEEAMTKLLVPMVLMLLVVMIIIMVPAFSTMGL